MLLSVFNSVCQQ